MVLQLSYSSVEWCQGYQGPDPFLGHFLLCWLAGLPPSAGIAFSMQEDDPIPAEPHRWRIYVAAVAVLYLIFTWAAWHIAIAWGGHTITYTTMIICAAGCLAAAGEALPQAKWPQRAAAALALAPTLPVIVLPIGGLLLLQCVAAAAPLLAVSFVCDSYLAWPWRATAATLYVIALVANVARGPADVERHEAKTIQVPRRPPMNDGGDSTDLPDEINTKPTVCVIGGGMAGVVAAKELLQRGCAVTLLEKGPELGGVWREAWGGTRSTSSLLNTSFSDFSLPAFVETVRDGRGAYPRHFSRDEYRCYLRAYAERFGVLECVICDAEVVTVRKAGDAYEVGWLEGPRDVAQLTTRETFTHVVVATGLAHAKKPFDAPGLNTFKGRVVTHYEGNPSFQNERVVVVGAGETASDVAADVSRTARVVHVVMRSPTFWLARHAPFFPPDYLEMRLLFMLPRLVRLVVFALPLTTTWLLGYLTGIDPPGADTFSLAFLELHLKSLFFHPLVRSPLAALSMGKRIQVTKAASHAACDNCRVWPHDLQGFMGNGVRIGQQEVPCDSVVVATGFEPCYNFLPDAFKTHSVHERYLFTFHPELENVAFVGSVRGGIGSIPAGAEMQARWAALVFTGERRLPSEQDMEAWIVKHHERGLAKFPTEVTMVFANYLARHHVGCEPDLRAVFLRSPRRWLRVVASTMAPAQFRFRGPGASPSVASNEFDRHGEVDASPGTYLQVALALVAAPLWSLYRLVPVPAALRPALDVYY